MIRQALAHKERVDIPPINIVYEPIFDENIPVPCFFTNQIYLAYKSYLGHFEKGKECISNGVVKQCHYCERYVPRNEWLMRKISR